MKKLKYFFASAIVLVAVAISTIVFAEYKEQKGDIRFGNTISNNSITVTEGNLSHDGDIQINKTVTKIDDNGNYKVTFEVKGKDKETHTSNPKDVYAVVVLDKSNSMCNSANCRKDKKWTSAVNGAKTFAKTLHEKLPTANIALVTFADKDGLFGLYDKAYNDAEVLRNFAKADFANVDFGTPNGGTNLQAGLYEANELLTSSSVKEDAIKYVVVISDGEPTLYYDDNGYTDGPGSYMDATTERKTKEMAKTVQKSAEVFAIGYDYNGTILSEIASGADHVYSSDPTTIVTKFTDIADIIGKANAGTDATLTDNIGAKFVMTDAQGNKYTSEKFDITETGKEFSFNIKINEEDITEDGWYPTNAGFELTYTDPTNEVKTIKSTKNPEVYWVAKRYNYKIEYYYDGQIDNTLTETDKDVKGTEITVSEESIKNNTKTGYKLKKVDPENKMIYISSKEEENIIKVYYVTDETQTKDLSYTVEYYKDGVKVTEDTQTVKDTVQVLKPDTLTVDKLSINTVNKYVGYKFEKTEPTTIPDTIENGGVIKVYYVTDATQTKDLSYTVEYYKDGVKATEDTQTVKDTVQVLKPNTLKVDKLSINTVNKYVGYKFEKTEPTTIPDTIENGGVIKVYYVTDATQTKDLSYTVEYYKDGVKVTEDTQTVKDTVQVLKPDTLTVDKLGINTKDKYVGYKFEKTNPTEIPNTIENGSVIKVYYVTDDNQTKDLSYTVEYYKDGVKVTEDTQTVKDTVQVLKPDTLTVDKLGINTKDKYVGYKFEKTNPTEIPNTIENGSVIKVYYVTDDNQTKDLYYTVEYYKDGKLVATDTDVEHETKQVLQDNKLTVKNDKINTVDKYVGYKFEKTNPTEIPNTIEHKSIIKVYYVKGTYKYTVNYYYDNVIDKDSTDTFEAKYQDVITTYEQKVKTGYVLDKVTGLDLTISEDESKNVINVYYKKAKYSYVVEYYYDNVLDGTKTDTFKATYNEVIKTYEDKVKTGYVLDKVEGTPLTITEITTNNTIKVYYKKASYTYEVRYYFNRILDETLTEKDTSLYGDKITTYIDKVKEDYKLEKVENLPLEISEDETKNIINVYYVIDGQGVIEPIEDVVEPPHTSVNNGIYALVILVNALGVSVLIKKREN